MNKYYVYIDDSGKLHNDKDRHVFYSYIILDKKSRDEFNESYVRILKKIRNVGKHIKNKEYNKSELDLWYCFLKEKDKADSILKKYTESFKKGKGELWKMLQEYFDLLSIPLGFGTVCWCKNHRINNDINNTNKELDNEESKIRKRRFHLSILLSKLKDFNFINDNSEIDVYLDVETDDMLDSKIKAQEYKEYLNSKVNHFTSNLIINNIKVENVEFLESHVSFPIQMSDLLANISNKLIEQKKNIKDVFPYALNHMEDIACVFFPTLQKINLIKENDCFACKEN